MAGIDYSKKSAKVVRLFNKNGMAAVLRQRGGTDYDTENGVIHTYSNISCTVMKFEYERKYIDGTKILAGDQELHIAPDVNVVPDVGDKVVINGEDWEIVGPVKKIEPTSINLLYIAQIRK